MIEEPGIQETISIPRGVVVRKFLPEPDFLDFSLNENQVVILTDDGTDATPAVARSLTRMDWKVAVLTFPTEIVRKQALLPVGAERVLLPDMDEQSLSKTLSEIAQQYGQIAAFIHLHPPGSATMNGGIHFPESDRAIVRHIFLAAKHLKDALIQSAGSGRSIFMSVARMDGQFGLGGGISFNPIAGGLFGLVKTLNLEWPPVFCRALDISPVFEPGRLAEAVIAELFDPNRLVTEVAYAVDGRSTLVVEPLQERR